MFKSSYFGHVGIITFLLETKGIDVNIPHTPSGETPLFAASQEGHIESVKLLLGAEGIEINQPRNDGFTPLFEVTITMISIFPWTALKEKRQFSSNVFANHVKAMYK